MNVFSHMIKVELPKRGVIGTFLFYAKLFFYTHIMKFFPPKQFIVDGQPFCTFIHKYNTTWATERCVEVPWVLSHVDSIDKDTKILEIGNVLRHYFWWLDPWTIVDKYEVFDGVINEDVEFYASKEKFDFICTISTMEHVGYDCGESERDNTKILRSIENLKSLLKPNGKIAMTVPLGYNPHLDSMIKNKDIVFSKSVIMVRNWANRWEQVDSMDIVHHRKYVWPNAILMGIIEGN